MEIKRLITQFAYRIEPNPAGGFIAHTDDPNVPPIVAPTREELLQKIQAKIAATLVTEFPALKPLAEGKPLSFHIGKSLGVRVTADPVKIQLETVKGADNESERQVAESLMAMARSAPQTQGSSLMVPQTTLTAQRSSTELAGNRPITPESGAWPVIRLLLVSLVIAGIVYFFLHR